MPLQTAFAFNANELFQSLGNMIISQRTFADNVDRGGDSLLSVFKTDGSLYGDTKLFYATDALKSYPWIQDSQDALNLLATHRPADPKVQAIVIDTFRQIPLTTDAYMSKRAFSSSEAFSDFTTVIIGWMDDTKYLYDESVINVAVGTTKTSVGRQLAEVDLTTARGNASSEEEANRLEAQTIAKSIADILNDLISPRNAKLYNDYGFRRKYSKDKFITVWNADAINKITNIDLPTIFHDAGLTDVVGKPYVLSKEYFGTVITSTNVSTYSASTPAAGKPINSSTGAYTPGASNANGTICSMIETDITVSAVVYHLLPGDELPAGAVLAASVLGDGTDGKIAYGDAYIVDDTVLVKIIHKDSLKYMSAFETNSEFWNPKNLSTNRYLTFGYSNPFSSKGIRLQNYPFITVVKK